MQTHRETYLGTAVEVKSVKSAPRIKKYNLICVLLPHWIAAGCSPIKREINYYISQANRVIGTFNKFKFHFHPNDVMTDSICTLQTQFNQRLRLRSRKQFHKLILKCERKLCCAVCT